VRWQALQDRIAAWFADALTRHDEELAMRLASVAVWLRDSWMDAPEALAILLDHLEAAEIKATESVVRSPTSAETVRATVADLEDLLFRWDGGEENRGTVGQATIAYRLRERSLSSRRAKVGRDIPNASQTSRISRMSSRRSPDSYLLTKD